MSWTTVDITARLVIKDVEYSVEMASLTYQLNTIPRAVFTVSLGRDPTGKPSAAHSAKFKNGDLVKFYATITRRDGSGEDKWIPKGERLLFEGQYKGCQPHRSSGAAKLLVSAQGWLVDMDGSAATSAMSHPQNPGQFNYRAVHEFTGAGGVAWTPFTSLGKVTPATLSSDFWGDALLPWFQELTELDRINTEELSFLQVSGGNTAAAAALKRFTTSDGNYVPLALDFQGAESQAISESIWNNIQAESFESIAQQTLWGKLLQLASLYMFAVVPRVEDALVVPYIPGLQSAWKHAIKAGDYDVSDAPQEVEQDLLGVGVLCGVKMTSGADMRPNSSDGMDRFGVGGWYSPPNARGLVKLQQGPPWLTNVAASDRYASFAVGDGVKPISTAQSPGVGDLNAVIMSPDTLRQQTKSLLDAYAKSLYVYERLRLSQLALVGKPRFDIAPGSTVKIEGVGEPFVQKDVLGQDLYGDVLRVSILLDAEAKKAQASFNIGHVRTADENSEPGVSIERHPFWNGVWKGAGLLKEFD